MPLILNIETATEICSVCISKGDEIIGFQETAEQYAHTKSLTLLIEQCCQEAKIKLSDLDAVALSSGPGSYTALRVGTSVAKGICYGLNKPLIAIDTLQSIALATSMAEKQPAFYVPMVDARRADVYTAIFDIDNNPVTETAFEVINKSSYKDYFASEKILMFSGNGAKKCQSIITSPFARFSTVVCSSKNMPILSHKSYLAGAFEDLAYFSPNYFKAPNITTPKRRLL